MRTRTPRLLAASLLTALALTGCGDGDETATDPGGDERAGGTPSATPTVGTYPDFEPQDYAYTLLVTCYCPDAGVPIRVTVSDGKAEGVYAENGSGFGKGDPVPAYRAQSINDIIGSLNAATEAESVTVQWPEGQDYPDEVYIDESSRIADEEIGYTISDVVVG
ncbi:MAG TPA: DUF6174 domain-containing protein [Nocardioides sp.]|nr:DUF6174 domain-containing protein [Nocardioides sp.]